jgi:hypothetical protein
MKQRQWCVASLYGGKWYPIETSIGRPYRELCTIARRMRLPGQWFECKEYRPAMVDNDGTELLPARVMT